MIWSSHARSAQFGYPEIQRGFVPAMVMAILRSVRSARSAPLIWSPPAGVLSASEAFEAGLVSRVIPDAEFERCAADTVAQLVASSASALSLIKRLLYQLDDESFEGGIALGARINALARVHPDFKLAISSFLRV